jgi:ethylbenzene dioxygenase alpha subunit
MRCPYHGWSYSKKGELVAAFAEELYDTGRLVKEELGLIPVAQLDSYRGMIFATLGQERPVAARLPR